ncbi:MAG: hypothetical protein ACHREM_30235 [Polyangiales bacterium]
MGHALLPCGIASIEDPGEADSALMQWAAAERRRFVDPVAASSALASAPRRLMAAWAARWVSAQLPQVTLGHRLAAALLATRADPNECADVMPRWAAFLIVLPPGLLPIPATAKQPAWNIDFVEVLHTPRLVSVVGSGRASERVLGMHYATFAEGLAVIDDRPIWEVDDDAPGLPHQRAMSLLWRFALAIEIEMSDAQNVRPPSPRILERHRASIGRNEPHPITFALTREVSIDCREAIRRYVEGGAGSSPTVRTLVRGHWRRQAVGPQGMLRKWLHIEPYWRGPFDGPIARARN